MSTKKVFIIQYNDCYGNGDNKSIESVIEKRADFNKWLKQHNKDRKAEGNEPESKAEFDLIETSFCTFLSSIL